MIVNEYNTTYHSTIKMKLNDVKSSTYIDFGIENIDKEHKFDVGKRVRISKYKNLFEKGHTENLSEEVFVIKKVKYTVSWTYLIEDRNREKTVGLFYEKKLQKENQTELGIEKLIKKIGDNL